MQWLPRPIRRILFMPYRRIVRGWFLSPWTSMVFFMVFGRWPDRAERKILSENIRYSSSLTNSSVFRAVLSLFDQKNYATSFTVRLTADDVSVVEYAGVKVATDVAEPVISYSITHGDYERHMVNFFQRILRPGMKVVDVGANIGLFSLLAAKLVGEEGAVYSIEPRGENARLLLYSARINHFRNIHLLPTAVGDATGYTLYQTHIGANGALMTKSATESLSETSTSAPPTDEFNSQAILHPTSQVVPMARLDNLISGPIDVIKLDIEGAEGMALRGASELIRIHRPLITSEASMEMLDRVSNMTLHNYLLFTRNQNYRQFVIPREGSALQEVDDLMQFLAAWPDPCHIEDFVFVPEEKFSNFALSTSATSS